MNTPHLPHFRTPTKRHTLFGLTLLLLLVLGTISSRLETPAPDLASARHPSLDTPPAPLLIRVLLLPSQLHLP